MLSQIHTRDKSTVPHCSTYLVWRKGVGGSSHGAKTKDGVRRREGTGEEGRHSVVVKSADYE